MTPGYLTTVESEGEGREHEARKADDDSAGASRSGEPSLSRSPQVLQAAALLARPRCQRARLDSRSRQSKEGLAKSSGLPMRATAGRSNLASRRTSRATLHAESNEKREGGQVEKEVSNGERDNGDGDGRTRETKGRRGGRWPTEDAQVERLALSLPAGPRLVVRWRKADSRGFEVLRRRPIVDLDKNGLALERAQVG